MSPYRFRLPDYAVAEARAAGPVGTAMARRYVTNPACWWLPRLALHVRAQAEDAFVVIDGTLIAMDPAAHDRPFRSGKHDDHGMSPQLPPPAARPVWAADGGVSPGSAASIGKTASG
jgi:hypothetical protein